MEARSSLQQVLSFGSLGSMYQRSTVNTNGSTTGGSSAAEEQGGRVTVTLSREGQDKALRTDSWQSNVGSDSTKGASNVQLSQQEIDQLQSLKRQDKEVRTHEQAHLSAAGQYARGGMSFTYQKGPDGVSYAVGGEVGVDLGEEATPEATLLKMQAIRKAALAPADPSVADRQIAAKAAAKETQARQEILREAQNEALRAISGPGGGDDPAGVTSADSEVVATPSSSYVSLRRAIAAYRRTAES